MHFTETDDGDYNNALVARPMYIMGKKPEIFAGKKLNQRSDDNTQRDSEGVVKYINERQVAGDGQAPVNIKINQDQ